jgi:adenylate cyclase
MSDVFISYARENAATAQRVADALRRQGFKVWRDDEIPAHRAYAEVIEERLGSAKAVLVIWCESAAKSEWVRSEADRAREARKLVQLSVDGVRLPMPFDQIQCANLMGWKGEPDAPGWTKVVASLGALLQGAPEPAAAAPAPAADAGPPPLPAKPSIAVLPFANLSPDPDQDYFADGMLVEIVEALSRIRSIFVIASGSSLSLKGKGLTPQEVAGQLGVRYVLEGSVRKAGGRVRIGVQLVDATNGSQIWTNRFEDTLEDVFALQDTVALSVAGVIGPAVREAEIRRASQRPTDSMSSHELHLRALPCLRRRDRAAVFSALDLLDRAIALDPEYASALAYAAFCRYLIELYGWTDDPNANRQEGIALAHRAIAAAGEDAEVLANAARSVAGLEQDLETGLGLIDRAIALNPGSAAAWLYSAAIRLRIGQVDLAVEHLEKSMRLDPIGPNRASQLSNMARARFQQGRFAESVALSKQAGTSQESATSCAYLAAAYGHLGQVSAACDALARYASLSQQPIRAFARTFIHELAQRRLLLDGIDLAEGSKPAAKADGE